tara:strand:+ start:23 stop:532 length:510 start_codon:yes stop_codon:yes gene_type:complete
MINKINNLPKSEFIKVFANIFENSSWIAKDLYHKKPFEDFNDLSSKIIGIFEKSTKKEQLKILRSHPDLADKTKIKLLTQESRKEQNSAGLDQCTQEEFSEFKSLNSKYKKKFGFPFIIAVKGKNKLEILNDFKKRITYDINVEFIESKKQVKKIANLRLSEINEKDFF